MDRVRIVILWSIAVIVADGTSSLIAARRSPGLPSQRAVISGESQWVVTTLTTPSPGALALTDQGVTQDQADDPGESDALDLVWSSGETPGVYCGLPAHLCRSCSVNPAFSHTSPLRC